MRSLMETGALMPAALEICSQSVYPGLRPAEPPEKLAV